MAAARGRAARRQAERVAKERATRKLVADAHRLGRLDFEVAPRAVGKAASVHSRPVSPGGRKGNSRTGFSLQSLKAALAAAMDGLR